MMVDLDRFVRRAEPDGKWSDPAPLSIYRYASAYVLLGDSGAGKTTAFERERRATPGTETVTARDFRTIYGDALHPQTETLFIDGLDEARAGGVDPRGPFDQIRIRLKQLTPKRVRLSCRELDWLGDNDRTNLSKLVPTGEVIVLRLEPLNADEQHLIIGADPRIADPAAFISEAADRGVEGLLTNAQTLSLLIRVVAENGAFPEGRTETFEEACRLLAREPNDEHRIAAPLPEPETLVKAAGHMCAVSVLSGSVGFSLPSARESRGFLPTSRFGASAGSAEGAAHTRLFTAVGSGRFVPAHGNIAAFLAAQHLARLVDGQVPRGRILALLTGNDGFPPTPLRSLVAWLAVTSGNLRRALIERDPVAVLMYGDVRGFSPSEKSLILAQIGREQTQLAHSSWPRSALEALATSDMEGTLRTLLHDADRSDRCQTALVIATEAIERARPIPGLAPDLLQVARDETRWPRIRDTAFEAWIRALKGQADQAARLRALLSEIHTGGLPDPKDERRGVLLSAMVPEVLRPQELWDFYSRKDRSWFGKSARFWMSLPKEAPSADLPAHLDRLVERLPTLHAGGGDDILERAVLEMLASGLEHQGAEVAPPRLLGWLRLGAELPDTGPGDVLARIRSWLEDHPDTAHSVVEAAARQDDIRNHPLPRYAVERLLFGVRLPEGMETQFPEPELGKGRPDTAGASDSSAAPWQLRQEEQNRAFEAQRNREDEARIESVRCNVEALRANRAPAPFLHELALLYFRGNPLVDVGPDERSLDVMLRGDGELIRAVRAGLAGAPDRDDLPVAEVVLRQRLQGGIPWLTMPVLAGLDIRSSGEPGPIHLTDEQWRTALGCRHSVFGPSQEARWYAGLVRTKPELVAEVLILFGRALLRRGETSLPDFQFKLRDAEFWKVQELAALPLLRSFPVRARSAQRSVLRDLLWHGRGKADENAFREIVETKLNAGSMTKGQRIYWLAAGFLVDHAAFQPRLEAATTKSETGVRHLAEFFAPEDGMVALPNHLSLSATGFLIRSVGSAFRPKLRKGVWRQAPMLVRSLIDRLAESPDAAAGDLLAKLRADPALAHWRHQIGAAWDTQRVARRDAAYQPPTPAQVMDALDDGPPANAGDLRELVLDRLGRIAEEIRTTNVNLWEQFWNEDPEKPRHENACRNALLAMLLRRLPHGCDAQPEGQYAADRRADIRVTSGGWNIPVEIKKNSHADLWRAVRDQLLPRYTNDPATQGLGVYLVLWFGTRYTAPATQDPRLPSPGDLRGRLLASLTAEERRRAAVIVMDVTPL